MKNTQLERLRVWIETLSEEQKDKVLLELVDYAVDSEYLIFYDSDKAPRYDSTGEPFNGIK